MFRACFLLLCCIVLCSLIPTRAGGDTIEKTTKEEIGRTLLDEHGEENRFRIERGVEQAALFWTAEDGTDEDFANLCKQYFVGSEPELEVLFEKLESNAEIIYGYFTEMRVDLRRPLQLDLCEILPIDMVFGQFNPAAHLTEDLFANKIAFLVLLNFPHYSLEEKAELGEKWDRRQWAYARMGDTFTSRTPASVNQDISRIMTAADTYISQYNIYAGRLVDAEMRTMFPEDRKLISHWGLRDELKARYADPEGLAKQEMLYRVMERIILQEIPEVVIDSPEYRWNPYTNEVFRDGERVETIPEPDTRYRQFLDVQNVIEQADPYNPYHPTHVLRRFEENREIPEGRVEELFTDVMASEEVRKTAGLIAERLGRPLEPFDIWYTGFKGNISVPEEKLDDMVSERYPDLEAFEADLEHILLSLGFSEETAGFVAPRIRVDPARGAGHCVGASARSFGSRLRTRVPKGGMNYKGFNTAMHELGHAVEQTLTLQKMDYYSLSGVPNTAFTEAFAFVFQDRDLSVLGIEADAREEKHLRALDILWNAYEIMGVSLVDMKAWNWLYDHPDATAAGLREAVVGFAKEVWNEYYADVFGVRDQVILAVYSHMIDGALYLPDYPLGFLIQLQIEKYLEGKVLGREMPRMCASGDIIPELWMKNAVGSEISNDPLLAAAGEALEFFE